MLSDGGKRQPQPSGEPHPAQDELEKIERTLKPLLVYKDGK
jgi:hypothetical protein